MVFEILQLWRMSSPEEESAWHFSKSLYDTPRFLRVCGMRPPLSTPTVGCHSAINPTALQSSEASQDPAGLGSQGSPIPLLPDARTPDLISSTQPVKAHCSDEKTEGQREDECLHHQETEEPLTQCVAGSSSVCSPRLSSNVKIPKPIKGSNERLIPAATSGFSNTPKAKVCVAR